MSIIRNRGLVKWQAALIMPEHKALNKNKDEVDYFLNKKLVLDEYQVEEFLKKHSLCDGISFTAKFYIA